MAGESISDYFSQQAPGVLDATGQPVGAAAGAPVWSSAAAASALRPKTVTARPSGSWVLGVLFLFALSVFAQTDNTLYVRQFPGSTVGAKVAAAQLQCGSDTAVPCILVLDPSLAKFPTGSMPSLCSQCSLADFRSGWPLNASAISANVATFPGATADAKLTACIASFGSGGLCDARGFGATTQVLAGTVTVPGGVTVLFDPSTQFVPSSASAGVLILRTGAAIDGLTVNISSYATTYSGTAVSLPCLNGSNYQTGIRRLSVVGGDLTAGAPGTALSLSCAVASGGVGFVNVSEFAATGLLNPLVLSASASGAWVNSNHFRNFTIIGPYSGAFKGINLSNTGLEIRGNTFLGFSIEGNANASGLAIVMNGSGSSPVQANEFEGELWDSPNPWNVSGTAQNNYFIGNSDTAIPADSLNHFFDLLHNNLQYHGSLGLAGGNPRYFANTPVATGQQAGVVLQANGVTKWQLLQDTDNSFFVYDAAHSVNAFKVDTSGNTTVGESGKSFTVQGGGNILYRCLTAGTTLPIGSLTINSAACGTSTDTGLRIP